MDSRLRGNYGTLGGSRVNDEAMLVPFAGKDVPPL